MAAERITFTPRLLGEFVLCEPMVQAAFGLLCQVWPDGYDLDVTCIYRTEEEERAAGGKSGIHRVGPKYRAIDVRVRNLHGDVQAEADRLSALVNERFVYDPLRPEMQVAFSAPHGSGPHIHLQVHPTQTRRR